MPITVTLKGKKRTFTDAQVLAMRPWELKEVILAHPNGPVTVRNMGKHLGHPYALAFDQSPFSMNAKMVDYIIIRELPLMWEAVYNWKQRGLYTEQSTYEEPYYGQSQNPRAYYPTRPHWY